MIPFNICLHAIKKKFPGQGDYLEKLFEMNEDFRALCADYFFCTKYLQKFKKELAEKKHSIEEFRDVSTELENELSCFYS